MEDNAEEHEPVEEEVGAVNEILPENEVASVENIGEVAEPIEKENNEIEEMEKPQDNEVPPEMENNISHEEASASLEKESWKFETGEEEAEEMSALQKSEDRSEEEEDEGPSHTLPLRDYTIEDPSFLDEFDSTVEEVLQKEETITVEGGEEVEEERETVSDEDQYAVYQIPSPITTDVYDQICDGISVESTESLFSDALLSVRRKRSMEVWRCPSGMRRNEMAYMKAVATPNLIRALKEVALYQPVRQVEYLSYCLDKSGKSREELGMDPDPRLIQEIVDKHEMALESLMRRRRLMAGTRETSSNSRSTSKKSSSTDAVKKKYRTDIENLRTMTSLTPREERRIRQGGLAYKKTDCLGPTTLFRGYLPYDVFHHNPPLRQNNKFI